jgi:hypothetical protein
MIEIEEIFETKEKRMVGDTGYEVKKAFSLGGREFIIAENEKDLNGQFYMKAECSDFGFIREYSRIIYSDNYLAIMEEFIGSLDRQVMSLREKITAMNYDPHPITAADCHPYDYRQNIIGKVIAIKAEVLNPEYRRGDFQLVLINGGNGSRGNAQGNGVFCFHLNSGEYARFERCDVLGEIKVLPDWAKERLTALQTEREIEKLPETATPEKVAGYTITKRIKVGNMLFVLGENPNAVSRYVTWQRLDGRSGFDHGHYHNQRNEALSDLQNRANKERESMGSNKTRKQKSRDEAR